MTQGPLSSVISSLRQVRDLLREIAEKVNSAIVAIEVLLLVLERDSGGAGD